MLTAVGTATMVKHFSALRPFLLMKAPKIIDWLTSLCFALWIGGCGSNGRATSLSFEIVGSDPATYFFISLPLENHFQTPSKCYKTLCFKSKVAVGRFQFQFVSKEEYNLIHDKFSGAWLLPNGIFLSIMGWLLKTVRLKIARLSFFHWKAVRPKS